MSRARSLFAGAVLVLGGALVLRALIARSASPAASPDARRAAERALGEPAAELAPMAARKEGLLRERATRLDEAGELALDPAPDAPPLDAERPSCRVELVVVDDESGAPLAGFPLWLQAYERGSRTRLELATDATGRLAVDFPEATLAFGHRPAAGEARRHLDPWKLALAPCPEEGIVRASVRALSAPLVLDVEVRRDVRTVARAHVEMRATGPDPEAWHASGVTDSAGRARLALWAPDEMRNAKLLAWTDEGEASEVLALDDPADGTLRVLHLAPGGALDVHVQDARGAPVAGRDVSLFSEDFPLQRGRGATDERGVARFTGQPDGAFRVFVHAPGRAQSVRIPVELARGETRVLEVELPDDEAELAVEGVVLDEAGAPLEGVPVSIQPAGGWPTDVASDAEGRFHFAHPPCGTLTLRAGVHPESDRFAPATLDIPWGTRGVELRRVERATNVRLFLRVVDADTREPIAGFTACVDRGPDHEEWQNTWPAPSLLEVAALPEDRLLIEAPGHVGRVLPLLESGRSVTADEPLEVALAAGLDLELVVLDTERWEPLGRVRFLSAEGRIATSDAEGRVRLVADTWSDWRVEREGYLPESFDPEVAVLWHDRLIALMPAPAETDASESDG